MTPTEAALRDALEEIASKPWRGTTIAELQQMARQALSQPPASPTVAQEGRDPAMQVTASLVAAISILRRAHEEHKEPRKVVASDKMLLQMLADYEAAVEVMRSALSPLSGDPASIAVEAERPYPKLLTKDEARDLLKKAEQLWRDLQEDNLGGFSGINRTFYILHKFKRVIEEFGGRDVGLHWSKDQLDAALSKSTPVAGEVDQ